MPALGPDAVRGRLGEINRSEPVSTICQMGKTGDFAVGILANHGFGARSILGGAHHQQPASDGAG
jgi:rhodanese-related sulfurtransferase